MDLVRLQRVVANALSLGISGIYATKFYLDVHPDCKVIVLDRDSCIGGVWNSSEQERPVQPPQRCPNIIAEKEEVMIISSLNSLMKQPSFPTSECRDHQKRIPTTTSSRPSTSQNTSNRTSITRNIRVGLCGTESSSGLRCSPSEKSMSDGHLPRKTEQLELKRTSIPPNCSSPAAYFVFPKCHLCLARKTSTVPLSTKMSSALPRSSQTLQCKILLCLVGANPVPIWCTPPRKLVRT